MASVKVSELRQNLPAYLARVRRGERVRVTSRGRAVADLVPPAASDEARAAARARLLGTLLRYDDPLAPVLPAPEWDMNR